MFEVVTKGPVDSFFHLKKKADRDAHPDKVDVGVGIYRNEQGRYQELDVVRQVGLLGIERSQRKIKLAKYNLLGQEDSC